MINQGGMGEKPDPPPNDGAQDPGMDVDHSGSNKRSYSNVESAEENSRADADEEVGGMAEDVSIIFESISGYFTGWERAQCPGCGGIRRRSPTCLPCGLPMSFYNLVSLTPLERQLATDEHMQPSIPLAEILARSEVDRARRLSDTAHHEVESEEEEDEEVDDPGLNIDWSKGRCDVCTRRGPLGRQCRHCGLPNIYEEYVGQCEQCLRLGHLYDQCSDCGIQFEADSPSSDADPNEPEEDTADDTGFEPGQEPATDRLPSGSDVATTATLTDNEEDVSDARFEIDWSRGKCYRCHRTGQRNRVCRNCGGDERYVPWLGECPQCHSIGDPALRCTNCEDASLLHAVQDAPTDIDPNEPELDTDADEDEDDIIKDPSDGGDEAQT